MWCKGARMKEGGPLELSQSKGARAAFGGALLSSCRAYKRQQGGEEIRLATSFSSRTAMVRNYPEVASWRAASTASAGLNPASSFFFKILSAFSYCRLGRSFPSAIRRLGGSGAVGKAPFPKCVYVCT